MDWQKIRDRKSKENASLGHSFVTITLLLFLSFAKASDENRYVRPVIDDSQVLDIKQGRHPVIETQLPLGERYVPNDVLHVGAVVKAVGKHLGWFDRILAYQPGFRRYVYGLARYLFKQK